MEIINLSLSLLALIVAVATAIASHLHQIKGERIRKRDLLFSAITSIDACKVLIHSVTRERKKTGCELIGEEKALFDSLGESEALMIEVGEKIRFVLAGNKEVTNDLLLSAQAAKSSSDSLSEWLRMLQGRFVNFNNNRVQEIKQTLESQNEVIKRLTGFGIEQHNPSFQSDAARNG